MKTIIVVLGILLLTATSLSAQQADTTGIDQEKSKVEQKRSGPSKVYYGGSVGFSFGSYFSVRVNPLIGYRIAPRLSGGIKLAYEYIEDKRYADKVTSSNYGGSVFARYRFIPQAYAHAEYAGMSYKYKTSLTETERRWVPFLLLGGGISQPIGPRASAYVEVLFDVLQSDKSPYDDWEPWISVGVGVGF